MKNKLFVLLALIVLVSGCAFIKQGIQDYKTGKSAPLAEGEQSIQDSAQQIVDLIKAVPVAGNYAGVLLPAIVGFLTWRRGRRSRLGRGIETDMLGTVGASIGIGRLNLGGLVRIATDTVHGAFEVGADGSAIKRSWKVFLSIALALISGALFIPGVKEFVLSNTKILAIVSVLASFFGGAEKKIQSLENK